MTENNSDTETESTEEEVEPKLKYSRILNDLQTILNTEAVSCFAVHSRFLFFGTYLGSIYVLDHGGNFGVFVDSYVKDRRQQFPSHVVAVNQISVDPKGEYIATCSDDGKVYITGLYSNENNQKIVAERDVRSVALDPEPNKNGKRFLIGANKLTIYEKTFLKNLKQTTLCEAEGFVSAIAWCGQLVAWASNSGVRVYDLNEKLSLALIKWEQPNGSQLENYRCNLRWLSSTKLLIGWVDTIRICAIRNFTSTKKIEPISSFQTDFYVCGVAPLEPSQLVVLGYEKQRDPDDSSKALRPILCVLEYKASDYKSSDFSEICRDSLNLRGYEMYKVNDYHLDCLVDENRYFIVSPKDVVVASLCENDDRVQWFIKNRKFEEALKVISTSRTKYSFTSVAKLYLDHLMSLQKYDEAGKLCERAFGNNKNLWEEEIYKFVKVRQLRSVSLYLPRGKDCKLNPHIYEMVLFEFLKLDPKGFLVLIKEWDPSLYSTSAVINAIRDNFILKESNVLIEALARLYFHEQKYDFALTMFLKIQHKDVFKMIKHHNLYSVIPKMIIPLIELDFEKAIEILRQKDKIPPEIVVQQLEQKQDFLCKYLHELDKVDNSGMFHWKLVNLYAKYDKDKLLPFLKRSNNYPIQEAFDICKRELFYPEMVYLLDRMGNTKEALNIILQKMNQIENAIDFCKEHDDVELWNDLINESLENPKIMTKLLNGIVGFVNPEELVNKIKAGQEIPNLKQSLVKMLRDYSLQDAIHNGCNDILVTDYFDLQEKLVRLQRRALYIANDNTCGKCTRNIVVKDPHKTDVVIFNCRHYFHETCLRVDGHGTDFCRVCKSKK